MKAGMLLGAMHKLQRKLRAHACSRAWLAGVVGALALLPMGAHAAEPPHCLSGEEQRAAIASGKAVPYASVIRTLHRAPKDVIQARLCQEQDRLIYVLTLLGRDGKVRHATIDAENGAVVGEHAVGEH
jgi:hypothetical protein